MSTRSRKKKEDEYFSLISREKLLSLYDGLLRCYMLENFVPDTIPVRRKLPKASSAAAVAACVDRVRGDILVVHSRDLLPGFVKGKGVASILSALRASPPGQRKRFNAKRHAALVSARRFRRYRARKIVVVFRGTSTDRQWRSILRAATAECLPMIFVCNGDLANQPRQPLRHLPAIVVDRDDVVALYRVVSEGIAHARRGNGPTLIECVPWPAEGETEPFGAVAKMEAYLTQRDLLSPHHKPRVIAEFEAELAKWKHVLPEPATATKKKSRHAKRVTTSRVDVSGRTPR